MCHISISQMHNIIRFPAYVMLSAPEDTTPAMRAYGRGSLSFISVDVIGNELCTIVACKYARQQESAK